MKRIYLSFIAALSAGFAVQAQGISKSVQVENSYEGVQGNIRKQEVRMSIPDTLLKFGYRFNYSVFDSPYMGAYEFSPYFINIQPEPSVFDGHKFYARLGAGYFLYPELDLVYAPVVRENFAFSLFADARGYNYSDNRDLFGNAGLEARWSNPGNVVTLGGKYDGIFTDNRDGVSGYNSGFARFNIKSTRDGSYFYYDVDLNYRYGTESLPASREQSEHIIEASGSIGPVLKNKYRITVDFDFRHNIQNGVDKVNASYVALAPKVAFLLGPVNIRIGAKFDYADAFRVAPLADLDFSLFRDRFIIFAGVTGGQKRNTYYDLRSVNHRYLIAGALDDFSRVSFENFNAYGGFRGSAGSYFEYDLKAGYGMFTNAPVYSPLLSYAFEDYKKFYVELLMAVHSERFDLSGKFNYDNYTMQEGSTSYTPPKFGGLLTLRYNWARRIFAGISADARSEAKCSGGPEAPAFVDLGVNLEYRFNRAWGVWAKGGNLIGQEIQRIPGYKEKGPYFTLGFNLVL